MAVAQTHVPEWQLGKLVTGTDYRLRSPSSLFLSHTPITLYQAGNGLSPVKLHQCRGTCFGFEDGYVDKAPA